MFFWFVVFLHAKRNFDVKAIGCYFLLNSINVVDVIYSYDTNAVDEPNPNSHPPTKKKGKQYEIGN